MLRSLLFVFASSSLFLLMPALALAGSCPTCTSSADCMDPSGGPAFCVLHDHDVGCGTTRQICCPGQGCSTMSGRPSCEGTTCMVVDGPPAPDAAMSSPDAAVVPGQDAATSSPDAAVAPGQDAGGAVGRDAGPPTLSTSGCGCRASAADPVSVTLVALAGIALALRARRR